MVIVGAESTGKTTLARHLATHYSTTWVPEYGRRYTEDLVAAGIPFEEIAWSDEDFLEIARGQLAAEDRAAAGARGVIFCDTDVLATCLWQQRYLGRSTQAVEQLAAARAYDLYVLTETDVPFVQDGIRDGGDGRAQMTEAFRRRLRERDEPVVEVSGPLERRLSSACAAVEEMLGPTSRGGGACQA